jgi:chromosome segregation ATPase
MTAAREQLSRARIQLEAMRGRVGRLAGQQVTASTDEELSQVQRQQQETLQEYDRLRADVERYEQALQQLQQQASQAGVPPGWLR